VHFDEASGERETEAGALGDAIVVAPDLPEFFENRFLIVVGDANACVAHRNHDFTVP
jgi:hypothetical protein